MFIHSFLEVKGFPARIPDSAKSTDTSGFVVSGDGQKRPGLGSDQPRDLTGWAVNLPYGDGLASQRTEEDG